MMIPIEQGRFTVLCSRLMRFAGNEREDALRQGRVLNEILSEFGKSALREALSKVGMSYQRAYMLRSVASAFDEEEIKRWPSLTITHLYHCVLAARHFFGKIHSKSASRTSRSGPTSDFPWQFVG